ncbi:MAG: DUF998 domain-containing protein [Candidatus Thermoplasmatota archaeon]|jgi:hypothetical membrane protein|nr:DUF998 domain-containing protein [Candidatus Thermoplasmatota archaeon]MCL5441777.1 DUF998 domain-containing protein [Candidatus Thermoplasmatota archaeon]
MPVTETAKSRLILFGVAALASIFLWISAAWLINPWFDFYTGALSALGSPGATDPWIYNAGLMFTAILIVLYASGLILYSGNEIQTVGASFFIVAAMFLALIGIYHGGTYPHDFVSVWFFIQADIAIIIWGSGALLQKRIIGAYSVVIAVSATFLAYAVKWPSSAELETFGTCAISLWVILTIAFSRMKKL